MPARVLALMNQKGGVGKTTTTVNLAAAIAETGKRTLVIDLDPQAHATLHLGQTPGQTETTGTVYDILLDPDVDPAACIREVGPNLALAASETDLAAAEGELADKDARHTRLRAALDKLAGTYDYVLLDCPPSLGLLTMNGLVAAREVLIPMQAHFLALQGVGKLLETIQLVREQLNPKLTVAGIVLCMHDGQTTHAQEVVADLEAFFEESRDKDRPWSGAQVFHPPVRRNIKLAECPSFGQTIFQYAPWAPGAIDYRKLADTIVSGANTTSTDRDDLSEAEIHVLRGGGSLRTPERPGETGRTA
ncbi:MAG: chromosome partitioning protein ParA [Phycisphaeraceae bacterium]|nr:MAG: chromosome partitioning protein ParA [Phycisphaeraceae bacterium]